MNRYDRFTTGTNVHEKTLKPGGITVTTFGKLYSYYVDGAVYAQPLYLPEVVIPGRGTHNVLYVVTMNDKVYAFDADRAGPPLWLRDLTDEPAGVTPVPITDITNDNDLNLVGNAGIEGTPVIDAAAGAIYFVARTRERGSYVQRLHKLDVRDGKDLLQPQIIEASVKSTAGDAVNGSLRFDPKAGNQRPALALVNGAVFIAWASHEDIQPYHGWIMAYDAATLKQIATLCTTPDGRDGGVWQSGRGPAVDANGSLYFEIGNGTFTGERDFGTSAVRIALHNDGLAVEDYFTPYDYAALNDHDADLGSTGPLLVPGTNLLICGSKNGALYLVDARKMGHVSTNDRAIVQKVFVKGGRVLAGPAYWEGPDGGFLYVWCDADFLKGFRFHNGRLDSEPLAKGSVPSRGSPGGALTVSSDGKQDGIVWAALTNGKNADHGNAPGVLRAYDALTLRELWNSEQQPKRDRMGTLVKFVPPLVMNGRVYVTSYDDAVHVYGLR